MVDSRDFDWVHWDPKLEAYVYRAFSIGKCAPALVSCRLGESSVSPQGRFRAALEASSDAEDRAIRAYELMTGHDVLWKQKTVTLEVPLDGMELPHDVLVRGHVDGLDQQTDELLEIKSFGDNYFDLYNRGGLDALPGSLGLEYKWQKAVLGHAAGRKVRQVVFHKTADEKAPLEDVLIIGPAEDPEDIVPFEELIGRIKAIEEYAETDTIPDCDRGCKPGGPFDHVHRFAVHIGDDDLRGLLSDRVFLKEVIKELTEALDDLEGMVKENYPLGKHHVGNTTLTLTQVNPTKLDTKALRKHHPDIAESFTVPGTPYIRMTVKEAGGVDLIEGHESSIL